MFPTFDLATSGAAWVLGMLLKGTALLLAVAGLAAALRRASASVRHLLWSAGLITVLALPVLSLAVPWRLPVVTVAAPAPIEGAAEAGGAAAAADLANAAEPPGARDPAPVAPTTPAAPAAPALTTAAVLTAVTALWAGIALLLLARLALGALVLARIVRRATPLTTSDWTRPLLEAADRLSLDRAPRLLLSDRLPMPFACGIARPAIVLPAAAAEWTDRRRRAVLCHELAHLRRFDLLLNALGQLACAVWWFHPMVWVAARRLRLESERACDDLVLGVGTRASEYADHLLQIVCGAARARTPAIALPMAQRREFEGRMLAILERGARRDPASRRHAAVLATLALAFVVPLAALGTAVRAEGAGVAEPTEQMDGSEAPVAADSLTVAVTSDRKDPTDSAGEPDGAVSPAAPAASPAVAQDTNRVVAALLRALGDSVAAVREDAAYALGQLEARSAVPALSARLLEDRSAGVREMTAWALGQLENREATTPLGSVLLRDSSAAVRAMAVWALGQLEDPASVTVLARTVQEDRSAEVRGRAAWALGTIGKRPAPPTLIAALRDADPEVRVRAAWALGQIGDGEAAAMLATAMSDSVPDVRRAVFWALGQMPGEVAQGALIKALEDADPEIRAKAARALAGGGGDPWPWPWPMPLHH
jgi:HEAT repeat protein/beta-lactamase regulating signal transducer with metallopeptidase domain